MNPVGQRHPGSPAAHKYAGTAKSHHRMILYPFQKEAKEAVLSSLGEGKPSGSDFPPHGERQDHRLQRHSPIKPEWNER